jgi:hypothetical protein
VPGTLSRRDVAPARLLLDLLGPARSGSTVHRPRAGRASSVPSMKPLSRQEAVLHVMNALAGYWPDAHVEAAPASVLVALPTGQQLDLQVSITPASGPRGRGR